LTRTSESNQPIKSVEKVRRFVERRALSVEIKILEPDATKTSADAARALGCSVAEIAKTIAFVEETQDGHGKVVLVILSGEKRVDASKLANRVGSIVRMMKAVEVKLYTGYAIGGVPPFPHEGITVLADASLFQFPAVWAAAGASNAVMKISPDIFYQLEIPKVSVTE
jgi:prolyl-tRNA editing enzyme YbaK/EbsC (Cys-tRNA(Pro) deacylase)